MAARCLAGLPCGRGPSSSLGHFLQGALWTRFLAAARGLGLGVSQTQAAVLALLAVSGSTILSLARRRFSAATSALCAAAWIVLALIVTGEPQLWNPSLAPLPLALFTGAFAALLENGGVLLCVLAAALLALSIECHLVLVELIPVLLAGIVGCARHPFGAALVALSALAGVLLIDSPETWTTNVVLVAQAGEWLPVLGVLLGASMAGYAFRRRLLTARPSTRLVVFLVVATSVGVLGAAASSLSMWSGGHWQVRYLTPALPGLAVASAIVTILAVKSFSERIGTTEARAGVLLGAVAAAAAGLVLHVAGGSATWSMKDAQMVAGPLYAALGSPPAIRSRVETRWPPLVSAIALFAPGRGTSESPTRVRDGADLVLLRASKGHPLPEGPWIATVDLGNWFALVGVVSPFLDRHDIRACFSREDARGSERCVLSSGVVEVEPGYPEVAGVRDAFPPEILEPSAGLHETFAIRIAPVAGPVHIVELLTDTVGWAIESVDGVAYRGRVPGSRVSVEGSLGYGRVVVGRRIRPKDRLSDIYALPGIGETEEQYVALLEAIDAGWVR